MHTRKILGLVFAVLAALAPVSVAAAPASAAVSAEKAGGWEAQVVALVNVERTSRQLAPIRYVAGGCLDRYAERWSWRLADTSTFEHQNMVTVVNRCKATWVGEDLVRGTALTPSAAVDAWMKSPGHRAVLLSRRARLGSVGAWVSSDGMTYASAILAKAR